MPKVKSIKKSRSKTQKPPAIDKLLKPSIGVVLGLVGYFFMKGMKSEIPRIDVSNEIQLREVLFGEIRRDTVISIEGTQSNEQQKAKNYVVLCHSDDTAKKAKHLSSVFVEAKQAAYKELADFVLMDCDYILPSGKSIAKRFDLDLKIRPTIFVSGRFGNPKQIPAKYLKTGPMLLKLLKQMLEPQPRFSPTKISNTKNLKASCLDKEYCAVLIKGDTPTAKLKSSMQQLMEMHEDNKSLEFASLDGTALAMTNLEEYQELVPKGKFQFIVFKKVSGGLKVASSEPKKKSNDDLEEEGADGNEEEKPKPKTATKSDSRLITSAAIYESEDYSFNALQTFLSTQMSPSSSLKKLSVLPAISTRTKKVEKTSAEKRNRILEQRRRSYEKQMNPEKFEKEEKDKESAERRAERRADREQKRAEHNKKNNVKQRTPEEIAERERARRQRMEEEAAKWNIQEEVDESDENMDLDEDGDTTYFEEDGLDEDMDLDEEDEDEDVIDMDLD